MYSIKNVIQQSGDCSWTLRKLVWRLSFLTIRSHHLLYRYIMQLIWKKHENFCKKIQYDKYCWAIYTYLRCVVNRFTAGIFKILLFFVRMRKYRQEKSLHQQGIVKVWIIYAWMEKCCTSLTSHLWRWKGIYQMLNTEGYQKLQHFKHIYKYTNFFHTSFMFQ